MKGMKDRVELLEYVLEKMGDEMDDDMKAKYTSVLEGNKKQIENLESQKEKAIRNAVQ
jgi:ribosomal protein S17E